MYLCAGVSVLPLSAICSLSFGTVAIIVFFISCFLLLSVQQAHNYAPSCGQNRVFDYLHITSGRGDVHIRGETIFYIHGSLVVFIPSIKTLNHLLL